MTNELLRAYAAIARREERERIAKGLRVVKAVEKAGKPITRATIEGVELQFGGQEAAVKPALDDEVETWIRRQQHAH
jgi:hypothetical protein